MSSFMDKESMTIIGGLVITLALGIPLTILKIFPLAFPIFATIFTIYVFVFLFVTDWRESKVHHDGRHEYNEQQVQA